MAPSAHESQAVQLRRYTAADATWYAETARDPEIQRFTSEPADLTSEAVERAIAVSAVDPTREAFLICGSADAERLGNLAIKIADGVAELSYWVAPIARGRGVASRAIQLACTWLELHSDARQAFLWTMTENAGSRKSAERAGLLLSRISTRRLRGREVQAAEYRISLPRTGAVDAT